MSIPKSLLARRGCVILIFVNAVAIYLHIPFCRRRCGYCDFNTYAGLQHLVPAYVDALCREIDLVGGSAPQPLAASTVFFGGGTPSLLSPAQVAQILDKLREHFDFRACSEITLEANPGTITLESLTSYREAGVNRLSLGMQSALSAELNLLERQHTPGDVPAAVAAARAAGFDNLSLDLIYGLPDQSVESWLVSLRAALALAPEHLSAYCLTVEEGTPLHAQVQSGAVPLPDEEIAAGQFEAALGELAAAGFEQYEISNFAARRDGRLLTCQHNLTYWRNQPYIGFGAGAHGCSAQTRTANVNQVADYIQRVNSGAQLDYPASPAAETIHRQTLWEEIEETMMLGLRLTQEGINDGQFRARFSRSPGDLFPRQLRRLEKRGLVEWEAETLRLSPRGRLLGNQVFLEFVGNPPPPEYAGR